MSELKTRDQIENKYKWDLGAIFESEQAWENAFKRSKDEIKKFADFKGKLDNEEVLKQLFDFEHDLNLTLEKLYVYAKMCRDQDNGNDKFVSMCDRAYSLLCQSEAESSFIVPELNHIDENVLLKWADKLEFADNEIFLREIVRNKDHVLSENEEQLLALTGEMANSFDTIFTMLDDVDMKFKPVTLANGETTELSHGRYGLFLFDRDRDLRRQAYDSMYAAHKDHINTLAAIYSSSVKKDVFYAKARKFSSVLEGELFSGNIDKNVYFSLINAIESGLDDLHSYVALRKKLLGLNDMKMYDMYVPLVENDDKLYSYEEAQNIVKGALAPLGEEYISLLDRAFSENWIDVYETKGKTSGAYSWGAYGVHPYMLLNFQGRLDDVFTLAHEAGHSMHTYFSDNTLPYEKAQYKIFVAEVASTVNEVLLLKHLLKNSQSKATKAYLLNHFLDQFRTTVFRQTMFAEFELKIHTAAENGESLTVNMLDSVYGDLNRKYYGSAVETDAYISSEWARIPHFYNAYYVYQYATGFSAAVAIADRILNNNGKDDYLAFLSSGGSNYPIELLKITGVDLSRPDTVQHAMKVFAETLNEFKELVK